VKSVKNRLTLVLAVGFFLLCLVILIPYRTNRNQSKADTSVKVLYKGQQLPAADFNFFVDSGGTVTVVLNDNIKNDITLPTCPPSSN